MCPCAQTRVIVGTVCVSPSASRRTASHPLVHVAIRCSHGISVQDNRSLTMLSVLYLPLRELQHMCVCMCVLEGERL